MTYFLLILFIFCNILYLLTLLVPIVVTVYQVISVSILVCYMSWKTANILSAYLWPKDCLKARGRSVLITGCDSGFGYATALQLEAKGWHVLAAVLDARSDGAVDLRANGITTIEMNVLNETHVSNAYELVVNECQTRQTKLWCVVNNAGIYGCGELEWGVMRDLETIIQINVLGYIRVLRQFLPLIRRSRGRVVNVSSVAALFSAPGTTVYSLSKAAVSSLTDGLRRELHNTGVDVIEIMPQAYKNTMTDRIVKDLDKCWERTKPEVKTDFGESYYQKFRSYIERNINSSRDKPYEVVDAIIKAVTLQSVRYKYVCCGPIDSLILWAFNWMPNEWLEHIVSLFTVKETPFWTKT